MADDRADRNENIARHQQVVSRPGKLDRRHIIAEEDFEPVGIRKHNQHTYGGIDHQDQPHVVPERLPHAVVLLRTEILAHKSRGRYAESITEGRRHLLDGVCGTVARYANTAKAIGI
jgi:hypothetical protein